MSTKQSSSVAPASESDVHSKAKPSRSRSKGPRKRRKVRSDVETAFKPETPQEAAPDAERGTLPTSPDDGPLTREKLITLLEARLRREDISHTEFYRTVGQLAALRGWNKPEGEEETSQSSKRPDPAFLMDYLSRAAALPAGDWLAEVGGIKEVARMICDLGQITQEQLLDAVLQMEQ